MLRADVSGLLVIKAKKTSGRYYKNRYMQVSSCKFTYSKKMMIKKKFELKYKENK
ncbi:hypothetical protein [Methanobrevibacter arboriphilus]|uniref:hypothetical protein n=1 Tax=Methanobrevibacter arboriphilus TaxID=39441 RepID=UPI000AE7BC9A|nr:hypothetical protein [Methanobrevibacter arboriphilus]